MSTTASWLLRIGVAVAFLYPPLSAIGNPDSWIGYFPPFILGLGLPPELILHTFGVVEVLLAVWILSGWRIVWPSMAAAAMLAGIVVFNLSQLEVLFRDVSIALAALALATDAWYKEGI